MSKSSGKIWKLVLAWSGGKDSALALYELRKARNIEIVGLLTTITKEYDRVSMHGLRTALLEQQAKVLGLPLDIVCISKDVSNEEYDKAMRTICGTYKKTGVTTIAFGDIFLEDVRKYREKNLKKAGLTGIFPLWKRNTAELAYEFIDLGFKAITTCVDSQYLSREFAGRAFDKEFVANLPPGIDSCGENGEFHTFVYDGPIFKKKISFRKGEIVLRDNRFWYCDLLPLL
jgi:uncharacterized protein (TIGR00290 family)